MGDSNSYIRDPRSLIELNNTLGYSADSILKLLDSVKNYLDGVRGELARQVEFLADKLNEAEQVLSEAEAELRSCEESQVWDEEEHEYRPSCSRESSAVARAREVRDECQRKYDEGCRIKSDCDVEIELYQDPGGLMSPPGGERTLECLATDHTKRATSKLQEIIDVVEEYASSPVGNSSGNIDSSSVSNDVRPEDRPLTDEEKKERHKNIVQNVIKRQQDYRIANANRAMKCPGCNRPTAACICHLDNRVKEDIRIINDDF